MAIPEATLSILDGQLGLVPQDTSGIQALIGTSSAGVVSTIYEFGDPETLTSTLGTGPLVEAAAAVLAAGAGPVICVKATSASAGSAGSVTQVGTGTSLMTVTGASLDAYTAQVIVKTAAAAVTSGIGTFIYTLDGGATYSDEIALPVAGAYVVPATGLTLTFAAGTLVVGDTYSFVASAPAYDITGLGVAMTALLADARTWFLVSAIGVPADASATAAVFSALDTKMSAAAAAYRYAMAACQAADVTDALLIAAFSALTSTRVAVVAGFCTMTSSLSGRSYKRGAIFPVLARAGSVDPSEDLGRVRTGPLSGVTSILRDEAATQGLDVNRFTTLRTHVGLNGFYITNGRIMAGSASDYKYWQHRRVMDIASTTVRRAQLLFLNDAVRVYSAQSAPSPSRVSTILEEDARNIEGQILAAMRNTLTQPGFASDCSVSVDRTNNVLSTETIKVRYGVTPLGYAKNIQGSIGFQNPTVVQA